MSNTLGDKNPKISIIIPVYNVEKYLQACIDSLISQTFQDIEYIFVNDASPDGSLAILLENEKKYPNQIRVIDSKVNLKQGGARNIGIRHARGEYIGFVDSDDFLHPQRFQKMYDKVADCDAVYGRYMEVPEDADIRTYLEIKPEKLQPQWGSLVALEGKELDDEDVQRIQTENLGGVCFGLYRKSIITDNNIWFPEQIKYEDNYWVSLLRCYFRKIAFVEDAVYYYRIRQGSTVRARNGKDHYHRITAEQMLMKEVERRGLLAPYREAWEYIAIKRYCFNTYFHFHHHMDDPDLKTLKGVIKDLKKRYPKWWNNRYFKKEMDKKTKLLYRMIAAAPKTMSFLLRKLQKI